MDYIKIQLLIVWISLPILIILLCVRGNIMYENADEKLLIVNPSASFDNSSRMMDDDNYGLYGGKLMDFNISSNYTVHENDSCICSDTRKCFCTEFTDALNHMENNTVVAITGIIEGFTAKITLSNYTNISIIGFHEVIAINCLAKGFIEFQNCKNILIKNITWISCGNNSDNKARFATSGPNNKLFVTYFNNFADNFFDVYFFGLNFNVCTNISMMSCSFEASMIRIFDASGQVYINQVHFLSTSNYDSRSDISLATGLIMDQTETKGEENFVMVEVTNSLFSQTESLNSPHNLLLFYILINDPNGRIYVLVNQTNFSSISYNPGWAAENGMVWIRILSSKDAYIQFSGVNFLSNYFQPDILPRDLRALYRFAGLLAITSDSPGQSSEVKIESCNFLNNDANHIMSSEGDLFLFLQIINSRFHNNKADSILFIATTLLLRQSIFSTNTVGQLMLLMGDVILANISELQVTNNSLLSRNDGLVAFKDYSSLLAFFNNINYAFNRINGEGSGFHFTSREIILGPVNSVIYTCIPSAFFFDIPPQYILNIFSNTFFSRFDYCINSNIQLISLSNSSFSNNIGGGHGSVIYFNYDIDGFTNNTMSTCTFSGNSGYRSLIYTSNRNSVGDGLTVKDGTFLQNDETVFYVTNQFLQFSNDIKMTVFDSNRAQNGAAVYVDLNSTVRFTNNSAVTFSNNIARRYGGAIYYDITQSSNACYRNISTFIVDNGSLVSFNNNQAMAAGNSIYFSISQSCNSTLQYDTPTGIFNQTVGEAVMSPTNLRLYNPAQLVNNTDPSTYYVSDIMLGQNIIIPACTLDLNEMPLWSIQFTIQLDETNNHNYSMQGNNIISVDCRSLQGINNLFITGSPSIVGINSTLTIRLNSFYDIIFDWKPITVNLNVQLSSCHSGFHYSSDLERCVCYTTDNIVTCSDSNSSIRNGYWFGTINEQPTVTVCPINYCNFDNCEATTGTCDLYPLRDNQCRGHRSGVACGNCEKGYTLSFDSIDCISVDQCTIGQTVLVITMSFLYWITVIVVVFFMMYFRIQIGYLYGITFYYSILDILLVEAVQFDRRLYQLVAIFSSIAKLLPQFLGQLCFVKGLSAIDQRFIHYSHPLAVSLILLVLSIFMRSSGRLSSFVSRAVIHAVCLLLLLSYTSLASTSLLLMRAIRFTDIDELYTFLSPDVEYFHGRHLIYGLVAILTGVTVVIGLPLLLSLEPFVNHKINFIKIKPLLDQFQGCYKDKFRYFASYYMVFRLIFLCILVINADIFFTLYLLHVLCSIMTFIHIAVRPYSNNLLNLFDSFMLLTMMLVISLLIVETNHGIQSNTTFALAVILIIMPLFAFLVMTTYLHMENIKKVLIFCINAIKKTTKDDGDDAGNIEMQQSDYYDDVVIVDQNKPTTIM